VAANLVDSASEQPHFAEKSPFATFRQVATRHDDLPTVAGYANPAAMRLQQCRRTVLACEILAISRQRHALLARR
jgi:hypothetical protein